LSFFWVLEDIVIKTGLLLEKVAELEAKDKDNGWTPLLWAVENGYQAVVKLLVEKGAQNHNNT
jgi:ankyrin repeat protein